MKKSYAERIDIKRILWHIVIGMILSFAVSMAVTCFTDDYHYTMPVLLLLIELCLIIVGIRFVFRRYIVFEEKISLEERTHVICSRNRIEW